LTAIDAERVVVAGLGLSGVAAAEALLEEGCTVRVTDSSSSAKLKARAEVLRSKGAEVMIGGHDPEWISWADLMVVSPGIPPATPFVAEAVERGLKVWSELELGWRFCEAPVAAVTGTNGKTTTTTLLNEMFRAGHLNSVAAGNIGLPLVEAARTNPGLEVIACEVSSFQLWFIETFRPSQAVLLNVANDHYDWHHDFKEYLSAKARITLNQTPEDLLVVREDASCLSVAARSSARVAAFALEPPREVVARVEGELGRPVHAVGGVGAGVASVEVAGERAWSMPVADIRLPGPHNLENVLAAAIAATCAGVSPQAISAAAARFEGLPHRTAYVAERDGVTYIDDSKATNPHATKSAVRGLDHVVLIAGGRAKGIDLSELSQIKDRLAGVVVMGEAAAELKEIFLGVPVADAADVEEAARKAAAMASAGDTVLLSPACASLDQYSGYAERGARFAKAVLEL
jgi:UDP-N-acetylmuramoylalanine--D-glutamate ligase